MLTFDEELMAIGGSTGKERLHRNRYMSILSRLIV